MPENPPKKEDFDCEDEKNDGSNEIPDESGVWREDQQKRGYYYDDAHGYEIYRDEEDEENEK